MHLGLVAPALLGQLSGAAAGVELVAAAAASPRPVMCGRPDAHASGERTLWERANVPRVQRYCQALGRGYSALVRHPDQALRSADDAARLMGDAPGAWVLRGRALVGLGRLAEGYRAFLRARQISPSSLRTPGSLRDYAVSAAAAGQLPAAAAAFRALVPQAALLASSLERQRVYVESAAWVMEEGADGLDEAIGYLGEARRQGAWPGYEVFVLGTLALALDRQGHAAEAQGVAAETVGPGALLRRLADPDAATVLEPLLPQGELVAVTAILAQKEDAALAREQWSTYLEQVGTGHVWRQHALQKLQALGGGSR